MYSGLEGVEKVDWASHHGAYGSAAQVPDLLKAVAKGDTAPWQDLWGIVCHQGTVYDVSPVVVPYLVEFVTNEECNEGTRLQAAFLLASLASADTFVLPDQPTAVFAAWVRSPDGPVPTREIVAECVAAVASRSTALGEALGSSSVPVQGGIVAALGAVGPSVSAEAAEALRKLRDHEHELLQLATGISLDLIEGRSTAEKVKKAAEADEEIEELFEADYDAPENVRAIRIVYELGARASAC